jgi:hypothetical protein
LWLPTFALFIGTAWTRCAFSQQSPADLQQPDFQTDVRNAKTGKHANTPCIKPAPVVSLQDYEGPMKKTVGFFARALERKAVNPPRYKPGVFLCSLETLDKFVLFLQDSLNPVAFLSTGFNAGLDQASDRDHAFGQGTKGYAKRYGASFADQASSKFFKDFAFPTLFSEDPRYYRMAADVSTFRQAPASRRWARVRRLPRGRNSHLQFFGMARNDNRVSARQRLSPG